MQPTTDLTPPPKGERMEFLTVEGDQERFALVLSPKIWALYVHFLGHGTVRCERNRETDTCQYCSPQTPRRWQGYLACQNWANGKKFFLCITPGAGWDIISSSAYEGGLRGRKVYYRRAGKKKTSNLLVWFDLFFSRDDKELPPDVNPKPFLDVLFQRHERRQQKGNELQS